MPELKSTTKTNPIKLSEQEKKAAKSARAKFERTMSTSLISNSSLTENEKSVENLISSSLTSSTKLVRPGLEKVIPEIEKCEIEPVLFLKGNRPVNLPGPATHNTPVQITPTQNIPHLNKNTITTPHLKLPKIQESVTPSPRIIPGFDTPTDFLKKGRVLDKFLGFFAILHVTFT